MGGKTPPMDMYEKRAQFVNEGGLYAMIMKSKKKEAEAFQDWVTDEVLPSIRKTGSYQLNAQLQKLQSDFANQCLINDKTKQEMEEQKKIAEEAKRIAEAEQKRADDATAEAERIRKEKLESDEKHKQDMTALEEESAKLRRDHKNQLNKREQNMYIITNDQNKVKDMYKVGRTKNSTIARAGGLNTGRAHDESLYCVASYECADACSVEDRVHKILAPFRDNPGREFFRVPFTKLNTIIAGVIRHQSEEYDWACVIVDEVIGRPMPCGKDADEYMAAIAAANAAAFVPIVTNEIMAREAMSQWLVKQNPIPTKLDWVTYQAFLRTFLDLKKFAKNRYKAREWKNLSTSAFDSIKATPYS